MKNRVFFFSLAASAALLAVAPVAHAFVDVGEPSLVPPGDTFTFDIAGFNSTSGVGYILGNDQVATFGTTQT